MRGTGLEPAKALSQQGLNLSRLTTPATAHDILGRTWYYCENVFLFKC